MLKMSIDGTIIQIFFRFNIIANDRSAFGRTYYSTKLVNMILRSLPKANQYIAPYASYVCDSFSFIEQYYFGGCLSEN